jgi:uncharacterized protein YegP (UPF0339 family)
VDAGAGDGTSNKEEPMIRFKIRLDKDGWRARLYSGSDLIWWTEGYKRPEDARNAVRIARESRSAPLEDESRRAA